MRNIKTQWIVQFGSSRRYFYTEYHADQFARALSLNRTDYTIQTRVILASQIPTCAVMSFGGAR